MDIKNKNVLVTGGDGFIGSHLVECLYKEGAKIRALSQYNSFNYWGWLEDLDCLKEIEVITGDIRDPFFCKKLTKDIEIVFHLAALIAIPYSYIAPKSYVDTNINGTLNVCQTALENGCTKIIHTSTSEVYGTAKFVPISEEHPLQPQSPYSASKISADNMALSYFYAFDLPLTIARPFNTYGPRQSTRAVIPTIISQIAAGEKLIKLGDTTPTRDLNYVLDTCNGFIELAKCENVSGEVVNIGSNREISIGDLFELIKKTMDRPDIKIFQEQERIRPEKSEVKRLLCDNSKIKKFTSFEPKYPLEEGIKLTVDWFMKPENLKKYKTGIYNV